ncbi:hypothetical protein BT63DRAFT_458772 [Microthyrium microscopicum]|uniref:Uncharacterized protein n=1 Tax=Microthyrium microscopicum TaxID=703497 RepID=A0A6A6U638_9PEZI|nr:hypothetical protein BT63DRAFT_458772 [Microthyrium microscopicum]
MKFSASVLTLLLAAFVAAAPAESTASSVEGVDSTEIGNCPNGWDFCGKCNGTSCKVAGLNYRCSSGSCTKGSGAGDGAICGTHGSLADGPYECPGRG